MNASSLPSLAASQPDPQRAEIQRLLQLTQFYKGRTDGYPEDERMDAAIRMVQIAAHLPVTGFFDAGVRAAILRNMATGDYKVQVPLTPITTLEIKDAPSPTTTTTTSPSSSSSSRPRTSLLHDLATFAILTSPAWGTLLLLNRPWTKLPKLPRFSR